MTRAKPQEMEKTSYDDRTPNLNFTASDRGKGDGRWLVSQVSCQKERQSEALEGSLFHVDFELQSDIVARL